MAWEDRTAFDSIETRFGLTNGQVIDLMRRELKPSSFRMWRERTAGRKTKHIAKRGFQFGRFRSTNQKGSLLIDDFAAVPWYTSKAEYEAFRNTALDHVDFFPSHKDWLDAAMEHERRAEQAGVVLIRIRMSIEQFETWQALSGYLNDGVGRSAFADERARKILNVWG